MNTHAATVAARTVAASAAPTSTDVSRRHERHVRVQGHVDDSTGRALLHHLLTIPLGGDVLSDPALTRTGPAASVPWWGSICATRVPVRVRERGVVATGYIDFLDVGAATTELSLHLADTGRGPRLRRRRRLSRAAMRVMHQLR